MIKLSLYALAIGFVAGLMTVQITKAPAESIVIYPTPDNAGKLLYKDRAGLCYSYAKKYRDCDASAITTPIQ